MRGHAIGFHAHSHCYYNGVVGSNLCGQTDSANGFYSNNPSCGKASVFLYPHPITPHSQYSKVAYFDHGPAFGNYDLIGSKSFNIEKLKQRFTAVAGCRQSEQSKTNPYIFAIGTHLWNIATNIDSDPNELDGISDLIEFKNWVDSNYSNMSK